MSETKSLAESIANDPYALTPDQWASEARQAINLDATQIKQRLEFLRVELRAERISYNEISELQSLAKYIDPDDVELLEAAGVPEFPDDEQPPTEPRAGEPQPDLPCADCGHLSSSHLSGYTCQKNKCRCLDYKPTPTNPRAHTATDWYEANTGNHQGLVVEEGTGRNVAVTYDKADAARIVDEHNRHAKLVAALRLANSELLAWSNCDSFMDVHDEGNDYSKALAAVRAALANEPEGE